MRKAVAWSAGDQCLGLVPLRIHGVTRASGLHHKSVPRYGLSRVPCVLCCLHSFSWRVCLHVWLPLGITSGAASPCFRSSVPLQRWHCWALGRRPESSVLGYLFRHSPGTAVKGLCRRNQGFQPADVNGLSKGPRTITWALQSRRGRGREMRPRRSESLNPKRDGPPSLALSGGLQKVRMTQPTATPWGS